MLPWVILAPLTACGAPDSAGLGPLSEPLAVSRAPIYGGVEDSDGQQNQGIVALTIGDLSDGATTFELCSGALIASNVVLTARHCVSVQTSTTVNCDQNGTSTSGPNFSGDQPITGIHVFTGPTPGLLGTPAAGVSAVFHPTGTTLCNLDVALLVLDRPITGILPLKVRLMGGAVAAESLRMVGYGQNDQGLPIGTRFRRDSVSVLAVGSTVSSSQTPLGSSEFETGEAMCSGDSGSPALDETTGAVVGVVSRGPSDCSLPTGHVYTSLAAFGSLFQQAFAMAGGAPIGENDPYPTTDAGPGADAGDASDLDAPAAAGVDGGSPDATSGPGGPVNLRAGQGNSCSATGGAASATPGSGAAAAWLGTLIALSLARSRRRVR